MTVSSVASSGTSWSSVESTTAAGTMMQIERGASIFCDELVERARARRALGLEPRDRVLAAVVDHAVVAAAHQAPDHVGPHAPQSDHAHLHLRPPGRVVVGPGPAAGCYPAAVSTSGSPADTTSVCSACADGVPSAVRIVQPSSPGADVARAEAEDRLDRDDGPLAQRLVERGDEDVGDGRLLVDRAPDAVAR